MAKIETLTLYARALGRMIGVDVRVAVTALGTACTDGKRIEIDPKWIVSTTQETTAILRAFMDHELLGHVKHTSFAWSPPRKASELRNSARAVLEDIRIEVAAAKLFPGVAKNLGVGVQTMCEHTRIFGPATLDEINPAALTPIDVVGNLMLIAGRRFISTLQADALEQRAALWIGVAEAMFGRPAVDQVLDVCMRAVTASSTEAVWELAGEVERIFKNLAMPPKPKSKSTPHEDSPSEQGVADAGAGQDDRSEKHSRSNSTSKGKSAGPAGEQSTGTGADANRTFQSAECGDDAGAHTGRQDTNGNDQCGRDPTPQQSQAARDALNAAAGTAPQVDLGEAIKKALASSQKSVVTPEVQQLITEIKVNPRAVGRTHATAAVVSKTRQGIGSELETLLEAKRHEWVDRGYSGRRLDNRALVRLRTGYARVFSRRDDAEGINTAVSILEDGSGSMRNSLADAVARVTAADSVVEALGGLLEGADVPWALNVFGSYYVEVKDFEEPWARSRQLFRPTWGGNTVIVPAYERALAQLAVRSEDRKLLVVVTDGDVAPSFARLIVSSAGTAQRMYGIDTALLMVGQAQSHLVNAVKAAGFNAACTNRSDNLGRFVADAIRDAIRA